MRRKLFRETSGFTLVEAVVAATLVATALVAVAHLAAIGIRQSAVNARALGALHAAQGKLEQLIAGPAIIGSGDESADFVLRWTIAAMDPADLALVTMRVCAFAGNQTNLLPEVCVATVRAIRP